MQVFPARSQCKKIPVPGVVVSHCAVKAGRWWRKKKFPAITVELVEDCPSLKELEQATRARVRRDQRACFTTAEARDAIPVGTPVTVVFAAVTPELQEVSGSRPYSVEEILLASRS